MSAYDDEIRQRIKWQNKKASEHKDYAEWRRYYRENGPVIFAEKWLKIDPETGGPIILSEEQKRFLMDLGMGKVKFAILIAGRGGGKSFLLAIYVCWRIFCFDFWGITVMGGSAEQSGKENKYIKFWIVNCKGIFNDHEIKMIELAPRPTKKEIWTQSNSYAIFTPCSDTAARGPHPKELILDEQAAGEKAGKGDIIETALGQVSTSSDMHVIKASTAQFVFGDFLKTWDKAEEIGYTRYHWALAKHISGDTDIYKHYHDRDPDMWISNVAWVNTSNIRAFRKQMSDDKFLVEILGGIGKASGLVFNRDDIEACTCSICPDDNRQCIPYKEGHCYLVQKTMEQGYGINPPESTREALKSVTMRNEGIDWGQASPTCYTIMGKFREDVFVLHNETKLASTDDDKIDTAAANARDWGVNILRPDPREWAYCNALEKKGFSVHKLFSFEGGDEKLKYLFTFRRFVERHKFHIPCKYKDFLDCLRQMSYDKDGKVVKKRDHNFDSALYGISYYGEIQEDDDLWNNIKGGQKDTEKKKDEELNQDKKEEVDVIENWEKWARKDKRGNEEEQNNAEDEGMDFPWGIDSGF